MAPEQGSPHDETPDINFEVQVPAGLENGVYANFVSVWHSPHEFTLDFSVTDQPQQGGANLTVPCRVVARVRIPLTLAEDMLRAVAESVSSFEAAAGRIRRPGED